MPGIFRGRCKDCGYESDGLVDVALAVLLRRDHPALRFPEHEYLVSDEVGELGEVEDVCLLVLPHPGEARTLECVGMTLEDASRQGRIVRLRTVVCRGCGTVYRRRRLFAAMGSTGCMVGLAVCLVSGVGAGIWRGSFEVGVLASCVAMMVVAVGVELFEWSLLLRFRRRARALRRPETCPEVGAVRRSRSFGGGVFRVLAAGGVVSGLSWLVGLEGVVSRGGLGFAAKVAAGADRG